MADFDDVLANPKNLKYFITLKLFGISRSNFQDFLCDIKTTYGVTFSKINGVWVSYFNFC